MGVVSTRVHGDRSEPLSLNSHRPWVTSSLSTCTNQPSNQQLAASPYNCPPCCSLQSSPPLSYLQAAASRKCPCLECQCRPPPWTPQCQCQVVLDGQRNLYVEQQ